MATSGRATFGVKLSRNQVPILRITHVGSEVEAELTGCGPRLTERRPFSFSLSAHDAENIRWYLEDYRIYPVDPQPKIAAGIRHRMADVGRELFRHVLAAPGGGDSHVWAKARGSLGEMRIEIETELSDALVPWELMRDPVADQPLVLDVPSFVRCHSRPARSPIPITASAGKIRILLAICRPKEDEDVPFRSVARRLLRGLSDAAREPFHLEVLRPPTFEQLSRRLREAKMQGEPFHAVHFDGHGLRGKVFFENPGQKRNSQPVSAADFGKLLHETAVPLLILNACRSAGSEPPPAPEKATDEANDPHEQIRQFGSFAHLVMDQGATGVLAWRYKVFVDTAAQYMADLYSALASGQPLGEAATLARKQLNANGGRDIEDWSVPLVFEAEPAQLFPKAAAAGFQVKLEAPTAAGSGLPHAPDVGFIGRDETILKLDRTFDEQNIVLLHAFAGSGKTSTAVEFAGWYRETGGVDGPVLFTSFEHHKTLTRVLDELGRLFEEVLAGNGIQWLTLVDTQRRDVALQLLRQFPVLWIWDNVEPIAGFPSGTQSAWSATEQDDLLNFLQAARSTRAKFLLTSRRDEHVWLHDLPARIELPPMRLYDCVRMTEALAKKLGRRLDDVDDWRPLLSFTQGNPLTLTVLVGQALRDGLKSRTQIEQFVAKLRAGEAAFKDEEKEGRTRSLAASLQYGFENAFTEGERKQLALLHLFQGSVDVDALKFMGDPESDWCLTDEKGLTREAGIALLDRAAEVGLLTALGGGYYTIHPALPWFFRRLFEERDAETQLAATRAFVDAIGEVGSWYFGQYEQGIPDVIAALAAEEPNLLHARTLARTHGCWHRVISTMQGLRTLYVHTGRREDWERRVDEIVPDFADPSTDGPLPGKGEEWSLLTEYRAGLAREARNWNEAARLLELHVVWDRHRSGAILTKPSQAWTEAEKSSLRTLAASLHSLAQIEREQGSAACVNGYNEALSIAQQIGDSRVAATCALNLGNAYKDLASIRDLALAEQSYRCSFNLVGKKDRMGRAKCLGQLGSVEYRRFLEARDTNRPSEACAGFLSSAEKYYQQALKMFPGDAIEDLSAVHNQLGLIFNAAGMIDAALHHYRESIRYAEGLQDRFEAGNSRYNAAVTLAQAGRFADAREWAQSALRDYQACNNADQDVVDTLKLLERIESALQANSQPS